jgi:hypothetical protein
MPLINFRWELDIDPLNAFLKANRNWMTERPWVPIVACILYGIAIVLGKRYFATRERWNWRYTLAAWNLGLSVFSAVGVARTLPKLAYNFFHYSLQENFCFDPEAHFGCGSTGLWLQLFVLSKFPELFDTFFIVIHKKPLIFLHWYHHITVLLYCWHSYMVKAPPGFVFAVMNYSVHSIMYFYYFLMAIRAKPKAFRAVYITLAQISQMVVGVAITIVSCYYLYWDKTLDSKHCFLTKENNLAGMIMYGSYLFLFLNFFLGRYFGGSVAETGSGITSTKPSRNNSLKQE